MNSTGVYAARDDGILVFGVELLGLEVVMGFGRVEMMSRPWWISGVL